ncbi:hypothetical protein OAF39_02720 [Akkermansiaceae bacterium]|nr:hypothetical protein [Akkermansiaceae bacterium]
MKRSTPSTETKSPAEIFITSCAILPNLIVIEVLEKRKEYQGRIKNQVMIDQRTPIVEERTRIGDWEMDTVIDRASGPVTVTMVERRSRFTLIRLVHQRMATISTTAILEATRPYRDKVLSHT